jgi:uncharacterized protein YicC (UPF0701 family)
MALSSMTGFARGHGVSAGYSWAWELKSVNAKGLDLRLRLPAGWDAIEPPVRAKATDVLARGTIYATLTVERRGAAAQVRVNEEVLAAVLAVVKQLSGRVDTSVPARRPARHQGRRRGRRRGGAAGQASRRRSRGRRRRLRRGARRPCRDAPARRRWLGHPGCARHPRSCGRAEAAPGRKPEAIKARLAEQIATLLEASQRFDPDRLHQEALLMASKADIREELDRLAAHVAQAKKLLGDGGPVGRKLDFLAQELNRESNTLCAKANDVDLTNIGLALKGVVEQFREQVQNLE